MPLAKDELRLTLPNDELGLMFLNDELGLTLPNDELGLALPNNELGLTLSELLSDVDWTFIVNVLGDSVDSDGRNDDKVTGKEDTFRDGEDEATRDSICIYI